MTSSALLPLAAWAAHLSAAATVITAVTGILFFAKGQPFGTLNDVATVFQALFTLPLEWALHALLGQQVRVLSATAMAVGTIGMLSMGVLQVLLVLRRVTFEQTFRAVLAGGAAMGVWLVIVSSLVLAGRGPSGAMAWIGVVAGSGYILSAVVYFATGRQGALFFLAAATGLVAYSVWAIWLGCVAQSGTLAGVEGVPLRRCNPTRTSPTRAHSASTSTRPLMLPRGCGVRIHRPPRMRPKSRRPSRQRHGIEWHLQPVGLYFGSFTVDRRPGTVVAGSHMSGRRPRPHVGALPPRQGLRRPGGRIWNLTT